MRYAAEAIVSAAPPPSKPTAPKSAPQAQQTESEPSFDDHLAAETDDTAVQPSPAARDSNARDEAAPVEASAADEPAAADVNADAAPQPAPQAPLVAAPVLVQLIAQTNSAPETDTDAVSAAAPEAPIDAAPPAPLSPPIDAAAPLDAPPLQPDDVVANAPTPMPTKPDHTKSEAAPQTIDANAAPSITMADTQAPAPTESVTPTPSAEPAPTPVAQQADAPPPQILAQAAPAPRVQNHVVEPTAESAEASDAAPTVGTTPAPSVSSAPRVAPEAPSALTATTETPAEPQQKIIAKNDDGSTQDKFEAALEKSAPRGEAKTEATRASAPNAPVIVADSSGGAAASTNADTSAPIAPAVSALSSATTHAAAQPQALSAEHLARSAPPSAQVAREIVRQFDGETTRFELRLDPPELGRVEVKLEVTRDHKVTAVIAADSPQALTELARHARELEQSLQSAGLELSENGLSFDLRQSREDAQDASGDGEHGARGDGEDNPLEQTPPLARPIGLERWRGNRVDVMA